MHIIHLSIAESTGLCNNIPNSEILRCAQDDIVGERPHNQTVSLSEDVVAPWPPTLHENVGPGLAPALHFHGSEESLYWVPANNCAKSSRGECRSRSTLPASVRMQPTNSDGPRTTNNERFCFFSPCPFGRLAAKYVSNEIASNLLELCETLHPGPADDRDFFRLADWLRGLARAV